MVVNALCLCLRRVKFQLLPNKEDLQLQQCTSKKSSCQSETRKITFSSRVKKSPSQPRCFPSTSVQKHSIARTRPLSRSTSLTCTSERPFYKPKWRSKTNLPVSQISTNQSSLKCNETCSKRAVVTWV